MCWRWTVELRLGGTWDHLTLITTTYFSHSHPLTLGDGRHTRLYSSQPEVSLHSIKQKAITAAWTQACPALLKLSCSGV